MIDSARLITAWIDLELAYRHLHAFGNEVLESSHWLRIAWLNIKAAYDGDVSNVALIKMSDAVKEMSDKLDIVIFNTHGSLGITRDRPIAPVIADISPKIEEIKKNLRVEIELMLQHVQPGELNGN